MSKKLNSISKYSFSNTHYSLLFLKIVEYKIYFQLITFSKISVQILFQKIVEGLKIHFWKSMKTNLDFKKFIKLTSAFISDFFSFLTRPYCVQNESETCFFHRLWRPRRCISRQMARNQVQT